MSPFFWSGSRRRVKEADGLNLIEGKGRFVDDHTVEVHFDDGSTQTLTADRIVINTGARPAIPPIDGLGEFDFLTSTSIMGQATVPEDFFILGECSVGLEFGEMFRRFGADVSIIDLASTSSAPRMPTRPPIG